MLRGSSSRLGGSSPLQTGHKGQRGFGMSMGSPSMAARSGRNGFGSTRSAANLLPWEGREVYSHDDARASTPRGDRGDQPNAAMRLADHMQIQRTAYLNRRSQTPSSSSPRRLPWNESRTTRMTVSGAPYYETGPDGSAARPSSARSRPGITDLARVMQAAREDLYRHRSSRPSSAWGRSSSPRIHPQWLHQKAATRTPGPGAYESAAHTGIAQADVLALSGAQ